MLAAAFAVLGGMVLGMMAYALAPDIWRVPWLILGSLLGAATSASWALNFFYGLESRLESRARDGRIEALLNLRPLTGPMPLDLHGWSADPVLLETVSGLVLATGARSIVECGSGWSTVVIARLLQELGGGKVLALEHSEEWAEATRELLGRFDVSGDAEVLHAPIEPRRIGDAEWPWYAGISERALPDRIELLLVDGPPANLSRRARYPALPLLRPRLTPGSIVVLDDGRRKDEQWIAGSWSREPGVRSQFLRAGRGIWLFRIDGSGLPPVDRDDTLAKRAGSAGSKSGRPPGL